MARAGVTPPAQAGGSDLTSLALEGDQHLSASRAAPPALALLRVDCEGCEHAVMAELSKLKASGRVHRVSGECHATTGLSGAQKASCLRVLRSVECPPDRITPYMTCERAAQDTADRSHVTSRDARVGGSASRK